MPAFYFPSGITSFMQGSTCRSALLTSLRIASLPWRAAKPACSALVFKLGFGRIYHSQLHQFVFEEKRGKLLSARQRIEILTW
jgi:hypothetical protein